MGFNKRYITKDSILSCIEGGGSLQNLIGKSDALILDGWSSKFLENYDFSKYQEDRDTINDDVKFSSTHKTTYDHKNFNGLKSHKVLSNILENLIKDPSWTEILLTIEILGNDGITPDMSGKFTLLKEFCIKKITNYYTLETREKSINDILNNG